MEKEKLLTVINGSIYNIFWGVRQRLDGVIWDHEAAGSNPATPTIKTHTAIH